MKTKFFTFWFQPASFATVLVTTVFVATVFVATVALAAVPFQAEAQVDSSVVKVFSGFCGGGLSPFTGSGLLFHRDGRSFVLTSEHVVLHGNGEFCHRVKNVQLGEEPARLVAADWGTGLALLELSGSASLIQSALNWNRSPHAGDPVLVSGFPFGSEDLVQDAHGYVLSANSRRHLLPTVEETIEIRDAHGEYGMSGGPVFSDGGRRVIGILSHQIVAMTPGGQSNVLNLSGPTQVFHNHLFVVPAAAVNSWLDQYFSGTFAPHFIRSPQDQIHRISSVSTYGLKFTFCGQSSAHPGVGGQGVGVGGQGVGVGGGETPHETASTGAVASNPADAIRVTLDPTLATAPFYAYHEGWLKRLQGRLFAGDDMTIVYFVNREKKSGKLTRRNFHSLEEFFSMIKDPGNKPVTLVTGRNQAQIEGSLLRLHEDGQVISSRSKVIGLTLQDPSSQALLNRLSLIGEILSSPEQWSLLNANDLESIGPSRESWQYLFTTYYDDAVEILSRVLAAQERLHKLRL